MRNREKIIQYKRASYLKNRDRIKQKSSDYYYANSHKAKERAAKWAQEHPEDRAKYCHAWIIRNPEKSKQVSAASKAKRRISASISELAALGSALAEKAAKYG